MTAHCPNVLRGAALGFLLIASASTAHATPARTRVLVKLDASAGESEEGKKLTGKLLKGLSRFEAKVKRRLRKSPYVAIELNKSGLDALPGQDGVLGYEIDQLVRPDLAASVPYTQAPQLWQQGLSGGGRAVAVLDTGVDAAHPFLQGRVVEEACFSSSSSWSTSLCPGGQDEQTGPDAARPCSFGSCWHGTHVAGIAAGNGTPINRAAWGVAPGADIIAVQVFSRFDDPDICSPAAAPCALSYTSDMIAALEHVADLRFSRNIAAVNMSLGGGGYTSNCDSSAIKPVIDLLRDAGIATVVSSGNDGYADAISFPACVSSAISVGAVDNNGVVAPFSNASSMLSIVAPGVGISSSITGGQYGRASGTSMAAPHVAGAWALMTEAVPGASVGEIFAALSSGRTVTDLRAGAPLTTPLLSLETALAAIAPRIGSVTPEVIGWGVTTDLVLTGQSFSVDAQLELPEGVTLLSSRIVSPSRIELRLVAGRGSIAGDHVIALQNPDGGRAEAPLRIVLAEACDLRASTIGVPRALPATGTMSVRTIVENRGTAVCPSSASAMYLSTDRTLDPSDLPLASWTTEAIAASGAIEAWHTVSVPASVEEGEWYVLLSVDEGHASTEVVEVNNVRGRMMMIGPNLTPAFSVVRAGVYPGVPFNMAVVAVNTGARAAGASETRIWLSADEVLDASDVLLVVAPAPELAAGDRATTLHSVEVPAGTPAGAYWVLGQADAAEVVEETSELNNLRRRAISVH